MFGNPVVELAHAADNPHVDLFVRVSEVDVARAVPATSATATGA